MDDFFAGAAHEMTAKIAYELWERRGRPLGTPEVDWFAAESALAAAQRDPKVNFPLYGITLEADEGPFVPADQQNRSSSN